MPGPGSGSLSLEPARLGSIPLGLSLIICEMGVFAEMIRAGAMCPAPGTPQILPAALLARSDPLKSCSSWEGRREE